MNIQPIETRPIHGGIQKRYKFQNGYGASVVQHRYSYGSDEGLWEIAVTNRNGNLCYDTPITSDVLGYQSDEDVENVLQAISELPEAPQ